MATIYKRTYPNGKTTHRVQIRVKGYPAESAVFVRRTDATRWAQQVETDMRSGRYLKTVEAKKHTFGDMIDRYVRDVLPTKRKGTQGVQEPQLAWWKSVLGHHVLSDVTPALIAEKRDELSNGISVRGRKRSPSTVVRYLAALSHCYSVALKDWGWVEDNLVRKITKPKEPKGRTRFLRNDERDRLLQACRESKDPHLYAIVVLALSTGMRRGEIMNLTWDRVDLRREVITLLPENTKNETSRAVPLAGPALAELRRLADAKVRRLSAFVFPAPDAEGVESRPIDIQSAWEAALKRAEVENFRFHDLRHSAASYLAMNGATLAEIAEVLGHKTLQMVKRYAHLTEAHTTGVVRRMNAAVFGD